MVSYSTRKSIALAAILLVSVSLSVADARLRGGNDYNKNFALSSAGKARGLNKRTTPILPLSSNFQGVKPRHGSLQKLSLTVVEEDEGDEEDIDVEIVDNEEDPPIETDDEDEDHGDEEDPPVETDDEDEDDGDEEDPPVGTDDEDEDDAPVTCAPVTSAPVTPEPTAPPTDRKSVV